MRDEICKFDYNASIWQKIRGNLWNLFLSRIYIHRDRSRTLTNHEKRYISRETSEEVDELRTYLKIFEFLKIKMSDDSDGDDIVVAQVLQKGTSAEGTSAETQHKESTETCFSRNKI